MFDRKYTEQVRLLLSCMPAVADEACFALKGGTAINIRKVDARKRHEQLRMLQDVLGE